ncbi:hydrogenobyrinate a,c-diamide synthase [Rubrivivax pictus]|uniref:Hydrogenobyrinate a,c-diamide synthase n=1 Tax=Pseudaquabacterium pictum TaxID=2315236 RepID=A0A480AP03_9BURK|nr:cobyrinate a,c-diamide synthase [Rubrivivax pictus]GCL61395.1 hydrogenobyrinate a,c-diamide synthase [Rubrivivax pictus]
MSQATGQAAAVLVAAPASGQGKTTVACALARLHARAGRRVRAFKCGPDFLDPQWLALASGGPVHSLDLWINGEADCAARLAAAAAEADLVVVEGVMGLFDGTPSAADLARRFGLPVLAVVDAGAMAGTFGALAHGLQHYRPGLPWLGVLANRVAGARHAQMLQDSLATPGDWCGALPRSDAWALPERHLGLVQAAELSDAVARLDAAADALATTPLGRRALADWPHWSAPPATPADSIQPLLAGRRIAVAQDAAFQFIYPANLATLQALGAQLQFFSPLAGDALPTCDAVWLPGGYPELHAATLAACVPLRDQLRAHVAAGRPLWAECGGMLVLFDVLVDADGQHHRMWGLLPGTVTQGRRLAALGPQQLVLGGQALRGHTFHHSTCATPLPPWAHAQAVRGGALGLGEALYVRGPVRASYVHAWFPSNPALAAALLSPAALPAPTEHVPC